MGGRGECEGCECVRGMSVGINMAIKVECGKVWGVWVGCEG